MKRLENKVALVVGGTSGIGEASAKAFAEEGAKVAVSGRDEEDGSRIVKEIKETGGQAFFVKLDVTDYENVKSAVKEVAEKYESIDILYNGAGIHDQYANAVETDIETYDKVMAVNLKGPFLVTKEVLPLMLEQGSGKIINIGSQGTDVAGPGGSTYVTTKHAIEGFTKQLSYDFGAEGINANTLAPGFVETPMTKGIDDERLEGIPAKRAGKPEEIAAMAVFLASDDANYMHGSTVLMDGGWNLGR